MSPPKKKVCFGETSTNSEDSASAEMDPNVAKNLLKEGATFVLLDVPPGTEIGVDMKSWNVGEKFLGIKMIPPGVHYVYYSSVNLAQKTVAPRTGFFHIFTRGEVLIRRWRPDHEEVVDSVTAEDKERIRADMKNMDRGLGVYPYQTWRKWISLSDQITEATLARLEPVNKNICSVSDLIPAGEDSQQEEEEEESSEPRLPRMVSRPGTNIRYTDVSVRKYPQGSSPAEITRHSLDGTFQLSEFLSTLHRIYGDAVSSSMSDQNTISEVLAEIQFAFLCFLVGMNHDSFEQWKRLVNMICMCDAGMVNHPDMFSKFLNVLYFQMQHVPTDFFVDIVSSNNFLCSSLNTLFTNGRNNMDVSEQLKLKLIRFETNVTKRFGWDFSQDLEDDAPVVVETSNSNE